MSEVLTVLEVDAITGEQTEREITSDELADRETAQAKVQARLLEQEAKAKARLSALAKLADLGLTAEEIAAL